jgi:hypothetical protein
MKWMVCSKAICHFRYLRNKKWVLLKCWRLFYLTLACQFSGFIFSHNSLQTYVILWVHTSIFLIWCFQSSDIPGTLLLKSSLLVIKVPEVFWIWSHMSGDIYPKLMQSAEEWNIPGIPSAQVGRTCRTNYAVYCRDHSPRDEEHRGRVSFCLQTSVSATPSFIILPSWLCLL